jgi:hypothetical protein
MIFKHVSPAAQAAFSSLYIDQSVNLESSDEQAS